MKLRNIIIFIEICPREQSFKVVFFFFGLNLKPKDLP